MEGNRTTRGAGRRRTAVVGALLALLLGLVFAPAALAQTTEHQGGEANLTLPDLSTEQFLGLNGQTLLALGLIICALGLVFGLVIFRRRKNCRSTGRCGRSPSSSGRPARPTCSSRASS